ncbi:MAG: hypothetical protein JWQ38_1104 [Flavipsychrobacter sp.]|nr:hypothetical protein [Flavipsychrobacter sp.]
MKAYIIVNSIILVGLAVFCGYLFYKQKTTEKKIEYNTAEPKQKIDWRVSGLLMLALLFILLSAISPLLFTSKAISTEFDFTKTGAIGDTIGGLMNPFITLAGVIVTGLAFYMQYQANSQQLQLFHKEQESNKEQFQSQIDNQKNENRIQQFESQFYEMLRLHRENVTEMEIEGYNFKETKDGLERYEKSTHGRKTFVVMKTEFECILAAYANGGSLNKEAFQKCYSLFFSGLDYFAKVYPDETTYVELLRVARKQHEEPHLNETPIATNANRKHFLKNANLHFNYKPFSGHDSRLGHYYRHLYFTVKSVVTSDTIINYSDKMKYLRILRAQLSNHEQIMLFYNWLGGHGWAWENEENHFFTEYCMIHNLWHNNLFQDKFIADMVNRLRKKAVKQRQGSMFEIDS